MTTRNERGASVFRTWPALRLAIRIYNGSRRHRALVRKQRTVARAPSPPRSIPIEIAIEAYRREEARRRRTTTRQRYGWILALTAAGFALSMMLHADMRLALIILAVVFFHELGHFAAMRAFGYVDATIFFIPFFGAASSGEKEETTLTEELIILLAGPLPGILLAAVLVAFFPASTRDELASTAVMTLFAINWANLLPLYPLDGGRIVDAILFARAPTLSIAFRVLALSAFLITALWTGDGIMFALFGVSALALQTSFRTARLERESARRAALSGHERADITVIFEAVESLGYTKLPFASRLPMIRTAARSFRRPPIHWAARAGWIGVYGSALFGGIAAFALVPISMKILRPSNEPAPVRIACRADGLRTTAIGRDRAYRRVDIDCEAKAGTTDRVEETLVPFRLDPDWPLPWRAGPARVSLPESEIGRVTFTLRAVEVARRHALLSETSTSGESMRRLLAADGSKGISAKSFRERLLSRTWMQLGAELADPRFDAALARSVLTSTGGASSARRRLGLAARREPAEVVHPSRQASVRFKDGLFMPVPIADDDLGGLASHLCSGGCDALLFRYRARE